MNAVVKHEPKTLIGALANRYGMEPKPFEETVFKTCMPQNATAAEFAAFLLVAKEHGLNPITREIYAFPKKGGGIQPIVGIDGWMTLINTHPNFDGMQFDDVFDDKGALTAITCSIYRKDRQHPTFVTEYMDECQRPTEPWQKWPARMLRHKATIQCARYAFGFAGIIDPEEAERSPEVVTGEVIAPPPPDSIPHEVAVEPTEPVFDPDKFVASVADDLAVASDPDNLQEIWDSLDVEATLTDFEDHLQRAFDAKNAMLKTLEAAANLTA